MTASQAAGVVRHIYPMDIPPMVVQPGLDFLLVELPPRYVPMMPNGLAYVDLLLRREGHTSQVLDTNIIIYHRYHQRRLLEGRGPEVLPSGATLHEDPWSVGGITDFDRDEVIDYFWPHFQEMIQAIAVARPKVVGISLSGTNAKLAGRVARAIRECHPGCCILVGGYMCATEYNGPYFFTDYDYMVMGEAEVSLPPLAQALMRGERPRDMPGILSRWDSVPRGCIQFPRPQNLDALGWPKYEWIDLSVYQSYDGVLFIPLCASRGCSWSRCRFCAERFPFRLRSPASVADEIQYFVERGGNNFHFNESDVNGSPKNLYDICTEVVLRQLKVHMMGQLRIDKRIDLEFLQHLSMAGFRHLRFGVDGWSFNALRLQRKGYNTRLIKDVLKNSHLAGIWTTVNVVVGVPGETAADIDETIENITECGKWIQRVESFNALILAAGSDYYLNPDEYNIKFVGDREEIYRNNRRAIPETLWYSEGPYIDHKVRARRIYRIKEALHRAGVPIGDFTAGTVDRLLRSGTGIALSAPACASGLAGQPQSIVAVAVQDGYAIHKIDGAFVAVQQALGAVSLAEEKIGDRELLPFLAIGASERELALRLRERAGDPDIDAYTMIHSDGRVVAIHNSIPGAALGRDLLVAWEIAPYVFSGGDIAAVQAKIRGVSGDGLVSA